MLGLRGLGWAGGGRGVLGLKGEVGRGLRAGDGLWGCSEHLGAVLK